MSVDKTILAILVACLDINETKLSSLYYKEFHNMLCHWKLIFYVASPPSLMKRVDICLVCSTIFMSIKNIKNHVFIFLLEDLYRVEFTEMKEGQTACRKKDDSFSHKNSLSLIAKKIKKGETPSK